VRKRGAASAESDEVEGECAGSERTVSSGQLLEFEPSPLTSESALRPGAHRTSSPTNSTE